ncbi:SixA phosphatase family protein [Pseudoduganella sp. OTU4001]|uniref:SixA phosphatase family protein n=1 Tax=Pseudoduganella sp. OTU4001 TaxID=3043854 RepID=UPI00313E7980
MKILSTLLLAASAALPLQALAETYHIYVSRHGEKVVSDSKDPPLTAAGELRARHIAVMLQSAGIQRVFSTNYQRTQQTAAPTAAQFGLAVQSYDPGKQAEFAKQVRGMGGNMLLVGHSNTIPDLVRQLGGDAGSDIADDEYNRLYHLTITDDGKVATQVLNSQP